MADTMLLETERLHLATWEREDCLAFRPIATDPAVMRYITGGQPWSDQQIRNFVERQIAGYSRDGFCLWKLVRRADSKLIGFCGLQPLEVESVSEVEIGWWLARRHWGKGLASEAAHLALRDGFQRVGLDRVVAIARPENAASLRVMHKLGMRYERQYVRQGILVVLYAVSKPRVPAS